MSEFDVVCVPIGEYRDPAHPTLPADEEAARVVELLDQLGGRSEPWPLPAADRHRTNVDARLDVWSDAARARSSVVFWVGHGSSDGDDAHLATYDSGADAGVAPEDFARRIRAEWGYRNSDEGTWAIVVIEACGAKRFVERVSHVLHGRPNVPERLGLIGASSDGSGHLGDFRVALEGAIRSYDLNDEEIRLDDLVSRIRGRLYEGRVLDVDLHRAKPVPRRRLIEGTVTAPLDIRAELTEFLAGLDPDERGHFIPKAQGAEQGELAWYFVGRAAERARIVSWLRTSTAGMLVVTGRAGSGKSALLGNVLVHTNPALRDLLTRANLLEPVPDDQRPPDRIFDAVVHLSGMTTGELVRTLTTAAGLPEPPVSAESGPELEALLTGIGDRPFCLLVDALDEAQEPASIASSVLRGLAALPGCRVVIGTRKSIKEGPDQPDTEDEDLLDALGRAASTVTVEVDRAPAAIATYVRRRLGIALSLGEAAVDRVVALVGARPRQFLFARLAVHEIIAQPSLVEPARAAELARLLGNDHRGLFAAAVARLTTAAPVHLGMLLALALAQGRGLPRADRIWAIAASALRDTTTTPVSETDIDCLLRDAAPYVMLDAENGQSVYRLAHQTFKEHFHNRHGPVPDIDDGHRLIARALIAAAEPTLPASPNPYLVHHLSAHVAAGSDWPDLAATDLLDHLDPVAVATDAFRTAFGRADLPTEIAAILSANHFLAPLAPPDRSGTRQVVAGRHSGAQSRGSTRASWSVRWSRLRRDPPHIVLSGHKSPVKAAAPVPVVDGRTLLATGDHNGTVLLWDPASATRVGPPITCEGKVTALVAVPKPDGGTVLAIGTDHSGPRLWDPITGGPAGPPVPGHVDGLAALAAVPMADGRTVLAAASGFDAVVRFCDPETAVVAGVLVTDHKRGIRMLAQVPWPDGRTLLATGGDDSTVRLWDTATGKRVGRRPFLADRPAAVVPLPRPDQPPLLAICGHRRAELWEPLTGDLVRWYGLQGIPTVSPQQLVTIPLESGPPLLASAAGCIWHSDTGTLVGWLTGAGWVHAITALTLPDGRTLLATGGEDAAVRLWDPTARALSPVADTSTLYALAAAPDGALLATGDYQGRAQLWDARSGDPVGPPLPGHQRQVTDLAIVPRPDQAGLLCTAGHDGTIRLWDLHSTTLVAEWDAGHGGSVCELVSVDLPNGPSGLASLGDDTRLRIWDLAGTRQVDPGSPTRPNLLARVIAIPVRDDATLMQQVGSAPPTRVNFLTRVVAIPVRGGRTLLATYDCSPIVRLWDPTRARAVRRGLRRIKLRHDKNHDVKCAAPVVLADGRVLLATGGAARALRLWDTDSWKSFGEPLVGHTGYWVNAVTAVPHPDGGQLLASGGDDGTVRIWHPTSGTLLLTAVIGEKIEELSAVGTGLLLRLETGIVILDLH